MTDQTSHEWTAKLDSYLDAELDSGQMQELDRHLRECAVCTAEILHRLQWKRAVHGAGQRYTPDAALRERIQKNLPSARQPWWHWRLVFAAAAALLLLLGSARIVQQQIAQPKQSLAREGVVAGELADLHVATLASANPVDVVSTDRHNVKPWFAGKIPFTFNLPDLQGTEFELVGGKVTYLEQSPGAQLLFRVRKHQVSVFVFQAKALPARSKYPEEMDAQSFHLESWQHNGLQYFAISDVALEDLRVLRNLLDKQ